MDLTVDLTFWVTGVVFIILNGFSWSGSSSSTATARVCKCALRAGEPPKLEWWLTVITSVGVSCDAGARSVGLGQASSMCRTMRLMVEVVGQQWHWSFRFPGEDGVLGQADVGLMNGRSQSLLA